MRRAATLAIAFLAVLGAGCGPGVGVSAGNALVNTGIAAGVSAARRADGECLTPCDFGTECNPETGLCETLPCGEPCAEGQWCDTTQLVPRCVAEIDLEED